MSSNLQQGRRTVVAFALAALVVLLAELAGHRSGLSAQGMQLDDTIPFTLRLLSHRDPFIHDVDGLLTIARKATLEYDSTG